MRENLTLAAQMRLSFSIREKFERIEQVMNEVGMPVRIAVFSQ